MTTTAPDARQCFCPGDCNCRFQGAPFHRIAVCGCKGHDVHTDERAHLEVDVSPRPFDEAPVAATPTTRAAIARCNRCKCQAERVTLWWDGLDFSTECACGGLLREVTR